MLELGTRETQASWHPPRVSCCPRIPIPCHIREPPSYSIDLDFLLPHPLGTQGLFCADPLLDLHSMISGGT